MKELENLVSKELPVKGKVQPVKLGLDDTIQFHCHKDIACFNKCCQNIDITLTPYDIIRLKNRLGMTSREFLDKYTIPYEMDPHGMPGVKFKPVEGDTACRFVTEEGCSVYEDRPTACRYYALGLMSMRRKDSASDEDSYFLVTEDHCLGHKEERRLTVREYRQEQGLDEYDEYGHDWRRIILKKRSAGPTVGAPAPQTFQLFWIASYEMEEFRKFVLSEAFQDAYDLEPEYVRQLENDEIELMKFANRFMRQVFFKEESIPLKPDAIEKRKASQKRRAEARRAKVRQEAAKEKDSPVT